MAWNSRSSYLSLKVLNYSPNPPTSFLYRSTAFHFFILHLMDNWIVSTSRLPWKVFYKSLGVYSLFCGCKLRSRIFRLYGNCLSFPGSDTLLPKASGTCLFVWRSEDFEGGYSPPPPWVPGIKLRSHVCVASHFSPWLFVCGSLNPGMEPGVWHLPGRVSEPWHLSTVTAWGLRVLQAVSHVWHPPMAQTPHTLC